MTDIKTAYPSFKEEVPKSILGYQTHNLYKDFPPLMSDGRSLVASWQQESVTNHNLEKNGGFTSNWQYRKYLTENSKAIVEQNKLESFNDVGYVSRFIEPPSQEAQVPHLYKSYLDTAKPFGYQTSDLKEMYLSKEQLNARKMAPAITQEEMMIYLTK